MPFHCALGSLSQDFRGGALGVQSTVAILRTCVRMCPCELGLTVVTFIGGELSDLFRISRSGRLWLKDLKLVVLSPPSGICLAQER